MVQPSGGELGTSNSGAEERGLGGFRAVLGRLLHFRVSGPWFGMVSGSFGVFWGNFGIVSSCFRTVFWGTISGYFGRFWGFGGGFRALQLFFTVFGGYFICGCSRAVFWGVSGQFWGVSGLFQGGNLGCFRVAFWGAVTALWGISACSRTAFWGVLRHLGHCRSSLGCQALGGCSGALRWHLRVFLWGIRAAF